MKARLLMVVVLVVAACKKPDAAADPKSSVTNLPPVKVETADVQHQQMPRFLTLTGSVFADRQSEVAANVAGRIATTQVERGKAVKQGDILAIVDSKAAGFSAAAANAQSQAAETQVELAKQECARADTLFSQGALAKAEFDRLKSQCNAELFRANAARANADLAGKLAGDTVIRAPIDGIVGERYINVGEYVQPMSRVASIYAINPVRVSISVPEAAVALVKEGQNLQVRVAAWPDRSFVATVKFVSPALRAGTRDLVVEASAPNADGALKPGMFASVLLQTGEEEQPTVPRDAIKGDGTTKRMFLARAGLAYEMVVRTGVEKDGRIAVIEPLPKGEKVILKPPPGLRDGSQIVVQ
jgi:membrane fusion protein (multidrug efflux system)